MKIGIITHYYKSKNYGGNLQAYALVSFLTSEGHTAEQICYDPTGYLPAPESRLHKILRVGIHGICRGVMGRVKNKRKARVFAKENEKYDLQNRQEKAFARFNGEVIPHSGKVYTDATVRECVDDYDAFVTGSDQVWNLIWYRPAYFLDFVPHEKIKISYAASMAMSSITDEQAAMVSRLLKDYTAISVRERRTVELLSPLVSTSPVLVLDPTLLLSAEDWDRICAPRKCEQDYVFCYFLGNNEKERELAESFAASKGLKLLAMPHSSGMRLADVDFPKNGEKLFDSPPEEFISLIKHAAYIFTDSFHAIVFSYLYKKQFFVFHRSQKREMSSRIESATQLFHVEERFCREESQETLAYIEGLPDIEYTEPNREFEQLKEASIQFLRNCLGGNQ